MPSEYDVLLTFPAEGIHFFDYMVPMGLASIAAVLEKEGFRVKIIDFSFYDGDFRQDLRRWRPKVVGIGGTTPTRQGSYKTARLVKEVLPECVTVYGGNHATFAVEDTLAHVPQIDYIIKGEGEFPFLRLCDITIRNTGGSLDDIPGFCRRDGSDIRQNRPERLDDLDTLPLPARHLFDGEYDIKLDFFDLPAEFLMTSRGCPAACTFCSAARMFPGGVRYRSMESIKKEIDLILERKPVKALKLFDSTFTADRRHVTDFCAMIKPYDLIWECEVRADTVDKELLTLMHDAGCRYIDIGLETANERLLKSISKCVTPAQAEAVLGWCREIGIKTKLFMIFGHLDQTFADCLDDVRFIRRNKKRIDFFANSFGLKIYPGTTLERQVRQRGIIPAGFSWARHKPSKKYLLFLETSDIFILEQPQLSLFKLFLVALRLHLQMTTLSPQFILKQLGVYTSTVTGILTGPVKKLLRR